MPAFFAPTIRRQLVAALEEHLLPTARSGQPFPMLLGEMPMQIPDDIAVTHGSIPPLQESPPAGVREYDQHWPHVHLVSRGIKFPYLAFLFEGEADLRIGTTQRMVEQMPSAAQGSEWARCGYHVLQLSAPALLFLPPGVPRHGGGTATHWERPGSPAPDSTIFWIQILREGLNCHTCETRGGQHMGQHSLLVEDDALPAIAELLHHEMRGNALHHAPMAHALLLILLLRLHRHLVQNEPIIATTARVRVYDSVANPGSKLEARPATPAAIAQAEEFISSHLHQPLNSTDVARHCGLSNVQLNRIFRASLGTSVKQYVIRQRVIAAQFMLLGSSMSIEEISRSLGFSQMRNFCRMFHSVVGISPGQYRKQSKPTEHGASALESIGSS